MAYGTYCQECRKLGDNSCDDCDYNVTYEFDMAASAALLLANSLNTQVRVVGNKIIGFDYTALFQIADVFNIEITPAIWRYVKAIERTVLEDV